MSYTNLHPFSQFKTLTQALILSYTKAHNLSRQPRSQLVDICCQSKEKQDWGFSRYGNTRYVDNHAQLLRLVQTIAFKLKLQLKLGYYFVPCNRRESKQCHCHIMVSLDNANCGDHDVLKAR